MSTKRITIITVIIASLILIGAGGCKKSEPEASSPTSQLENTATEAAAQATETVAAAAASIEQTVCPVMGQPINKELFTEYEGKKVYFCCPGCKEKFEADPEQYVAKLPQFKN